jgi:sugar lactone lactonase YvrE
MRSKGPFLGLGWLVCAAVMAASPPLDEPAFYPEGPTVVGSALYWGEMPRDRIRRFSGKATTVWEQPGCGPTSIKPDGRGGFWILCHLGHRVVRVDGRFKQLASLERDPAGNRLSWPNDATTDSRGQLYFTSAGVFDLAAPAEGRVFFVDLQDRAHLLAGGIRYANGIHLDEKAGRLYISEHLGRRVLLATVTAPGKLEQPRVFFDLNATFLQKVQYPLAGPDGLHLAKNGNLYVAEYGAGRVLEISEQGVLRRVIPVATPFVTNFAYWPERDQIVVTGTFSTDDRTLPGRVFTLPK